MKSLAPFLWCDGDVEEAAEFDPGIFPHARKLDEQRADSADP